VKNYMDLRFLLEIVLIGNNMRQEIVQKGHEALHKRARAIEVSEITSDAIQAVIQDMKDSLAGEPDGVAIAAPQIGIDLQIFVVRGSIYDEGEPDVAYINPEIVKTSSKTMPMDEGCLSVRYYYGKVERHKNVTIEAYNEAGEKIQRGAGGLLAHIFQHEIDHLHGTLFIDKALECEEMTEVEKKKLDEKREHAKQ